MDIIDQKQGPIKKSEIAVLFPEISSQAILTSLRGLCKKGCLEKIGKGRNRAYIKKQQLQEFFVFFHLVYSGTAAPPHRNMQRVHKMQKNSDGMLEPYKNWEHESNTTPKTQGKALYNTNALRMIFIWNGCQITISSI